MVKISTDLDQNDTIYTFIHFQLKRDKRREKITEQERMQGNDEKKNFTFKLFIHQVYSQMRFN